MEILGIGPLELVLILVVALLVFGPDKLPEIGANLGRSVRELRNMSREITQNVNTLVNEPLDELRQPLDAVRKPLSDAGQVAQTIANTAATVRNPTEALQRAIAGQLAVQTASPAPTDIGALAPPRAEQANPSPADASAAAVPSAPPALPTEVETIPAPAPSPADPES